jgi:aspartate/methionine/tyrosine aminotransferase
MEILERAQELEGAGNKIIHLEIGEPDFPTAPHICEAALNALNELDIIVVTRNFDGAIQ